MALKPNKIEYGGNVLLDLTQDNVEADALVEGYTAHNAAGETIEGTNPYEKNATDTEVSAQAEQIAELREILSNKAVGSPVIEELNVTENGTYTPPLGVNGYAPVTVNVQSGDAKPVISPLEVTKNGTYPAPDGTDGYSPVTVNVQSKLQEKSVAPSTQAQEVTPDSGYDGMIKVNVSAVKTAEQATPTITFDDVTGLITAKTEQAEGYVNEGTKQATKQLDVRNADNMVVSGATVTAPAGYYPNDVSKSVKTAERNAPTIEVDANGLITAKANQSEGYVLSGEKSATKQLPTMAGKTVTPSSAEQTVVSAGTFVTGDIKVGASSGGGGCPTCTIVVELEIMRNAHISFYRFVDNTIIREQSVALENSSNTTTTITVTNVVCASLIDVSVEAIEYDVSDNIHEYYFYGDIGCMTAPITDGDTGRMYFLRD